MQKHLRKVLLLLLTFTLFACATKVQQDYVSATNDLTIYLVRHAEKTKARPDPGLTQAGQLRSLELGKFLQDKNITHVHSSDYLRTRDTAKPIAELFNLKIEIYDPRDLSAIANKLKASTGTHLVVGHSNTTPQLVELLGGDSVSEINEANEYDRLYKIIIQSDKTSSQLLRYGLKYHAK